MNDNGRCPLCHAPADWAMQIRAPWERQADARGWERHEWQGFSAGVVQSAIAGGASYEKRYPHRPPTVQADVVVPGLQSAISGTIVGVLGGAGAGIAGSPHALLIGAMIGAGGVGVAWLILLREHRASLWQLERIVGRDLDGDGHIGTPRLVRKPVQVEVVERRETGSIKRMLWLNLPASITDAHLERIARAVLVDGADFSRRKLQDAMSAESYGALATAMLKGGMLRYKGRTENAGVELTPSGRAFLRQYVNGAGQ